MPKRNLNSFWVVYFKTKQNPLSSMYVILRDSSGLYSESSDFFIFSFSFIRLKVKNDYWFLRTFRCWSSQREALYYLQMLSMANYRYPQIYRAAAPPFDEWLVWWAVGELLKPWCGLVGEGQGGFHCPGLSNELWHPDLVMNQTPAACFHIKAH